MAQELELSRTPVREAIKRLESEGLVQSIPSRGTFVAELTARDISEIYQVREQLEGFAARIAAETMSDEGIKRINIESHLFRQYANLPDVSEKTIMGVRRDRAFWKATWMFMTAYENRLWGHFPLRFTVSIKDKEEMDSRCPSGRTVVIENGVNTREKTFLPIRNSGKILFMGTMNYYPNIDAVLYLTETIMPLVWEKDPSVRLCIAGLNPSKKIRDLASDSRIEIIGTPDDMREIAGQCCLTVVPLRLGGGTRIKILDAFAMGIPVISTSLGCEGLEVEDGKHIIIRDEPEAFAQSVLQVISDPLRAERLRTNGRKFTEDRYDWEKIFGRMEDELFNVTQTAKGFRAVPQN